MSSTLMNMQYENKNKMKMSSTLMNRYENKMKIGLPLPKIEEVLNLICKKKIDFMHKIELLETWIELSQTKNQDFKRNKMK